LPNISGEEDEFSATVPNYTSAPTSRLNARNAEGNTA